MSILKRSKNKITVASLESVPIHLKEGSKYVAKGGNCYRYGIAKRETILFPPIYIYIWLDGRNSLYLSLRSSFTCLGNKINMIKVHSKMLTFDALIRNDRNKETDPNVIHKKPIYRCLSVYWYILF